MTQKEFERLEKAQVLQSQMEHIDKIRDVLHRSDTIVGRMDVSFTADSWGQQFDLSQLPHDLVRCYLVDAFSKIRTQIENKFYNL